MTWLLFDAYKNLKDLVVVVFVFKQIVQVSNEVVAIYVSIKTLHFRILGYIIIQGLNFAPMLWLPSTASK